MDKSKISFKEFKDDVNARFDEVESVSWLGKEIEIKKHLELHEVLNFVDDVIDNCYQGTDVKVFMPELKDYAINFCLITYYTNIDLIDPISDEDDGFHPDTFITKSDIIELIMDHIDLKQFNDIVIAIGAKIEYINQTYVSGVMSDISKVNNVIEDVMPVLEELAKEESRNKLNELMDSISLFTNEGTIRQLAIQQVKDEQSSQLG